MQILEDGSFRLSDGRIIPAADVSKLYKNAPLSLQAQEAKEAEVEELKEGESSGVQQLNEG